MNTRHTRAARLYAAHASRWQATWRDFAELIYEATPPSVRDYLKDARHHYTEKPTRVDSLHLGRLGILLGLDWNAWDDWIGTDPFADADAPELTFLPTPPVPGVPGARAIAAPPEEGRHTFDDALSYFENEATETVPEGGTFSCRFVAGMLLDVLALARAVRYAQAGAAVRPGTGYTDDELRPLAPHARPTLWPDPKADPARIFIVRLEAEAGDGAEGFPVRPTEV